MVKFAQQSSLQGHCKYGNNIGNTNIESENINGSKSTRTCFYHYPFHNDVRSTYLFSHWICAVPITSSTSLSLNTFPWCLYGCNNCNALCNLYSSHSYWVNNVMAFSKLFLEPCPWNVGVILYSHDWKLVLESCPLKCWPNLLQPWLETGLGTLPLKMLP